MTPNPRFENLLRGLAEACAVAAAVVAALAWLSWRSNLWPSAIGRPGSAPLALSTALLVSLLGTASFLRHRWPERKAVTIFGFCAALTAALLSLLVWFEHLFGFVWPGERWFARIAEAALGVAMGDMSPITAALLTLLAAALLLQLPPLVHSSLARRAATGLAVTVLLVCLAVALEGLAGTPLVYGTRTIPIAPVTALAFALLSVDALLAEGTMSWPGHWFDGTAAGAVPRELRRVGAALLVVLLLVIAVIGTAGFAYLKQQQAQARAEAQEELGAITDLKVAQIVNWRQERLADAQVVLESSALADPFEQYLAHPSDARWTNLIFNWMTVWQRHSRYARVLLQDTNGQVRFAVPAEKNWVGPTDKLFVAQALHTNRVLMSDLHLSRMVPGYANLDIVVPLLPAAGAAAARAPLGVLQFEIDPYDFLYPLVQSWPTPSRTAETYLVRREGDDVLHLNELRHEKGTALTLRQPLRERRRPAALAVLGETGIAEGLDHRGVPVVAAMRAVPGTPWFLVAKVDAAEIYAPVRRHALVVSLVVGLLLLAGTLGVGLLWWQRSVAFYRQALAQERQRQALAERIAYLTQHANDLILLAGPDWRILEANDRALESYGYSLAELRQMTLRDLRSPEHRAEFDQHIRQIEALNGTILETVHHRKDGTCFPVEISARVIELAGAKYYQGILRDITERKRAEEALTESEEQLRQLSARLLKLQDEERRGLARELHDSTAQKLAAVAMNLSLLRSLADALDAQAQATLADALTLVDQCAKEVRTLSYLLHPPVLETLGLADAVRDYADGFAQRSGLRVDLEIAPEVRRSPKDRELALFRVLQESLGNVHRHSGSRTASIKLFETAGEATLEVADAGGGMAPEILQSLDGRSHGGRIGVGIVGMRERLRQLGGRLEIHSSRSGTTVRAILPLAENPA